MGSPVKVADELAEAAKETAELANRSMAKQIEHWARLGRAVEQLVKTSDVMVFKAHLADPLDADRTSEARSALERLVKALVERTDRDAARALDFGDRGARVRSRAGAAGSRRSGVAGRP